MQTFTGTRETVAAFILFCTLLGCDPASRFDVPEPVEIVPISGQNVTSNVKNTPLNTFSAKIKRVVDGDTAVIMLDGKKTYVRLWGIDAPERKQPGGAESTAALRQMIDGKDVSIVDMGRDRYKRVLGRIYVGKVDVSAEMVRAGHAWHYVRYAPKAVDLAKAEAEARKGKRGVWDPKAFAPWEYRRK